MEIEDESDPQSEIPSYSIQDLSSKSSKPVDVIYHISDLHIENNSNNYEEYNHVFDQLWETIKNDGFQSKILVITGDILHEQTNLFSETILYTWEILKKFNKIVPIIMIPGHHDIHFRNNEKSDGLSGIIFDRITADMEIHYLLKSGLYRYRNLLFCFQSLYDQKNINFNKIQIDQPNIKKIALYHGVVSDSNFSKYISFTELSKYDFVLLGEIHAFQFLSQNIGYAGSLISQNYKEGEYEHGCIRWDLEKQSHKFIPIRNMFAYKVLKIRESDLEKLHELIL